MQLQQSAPLTPLPLQHLARACLADTSCHVWCVALHATISCPVSVSPLPVPTDNSNTKKTSSALWQCLASLLDHLLTWLQAPASSTTGG